MRTIVRADQGFCRDELLKWCEDNGVYNLVGFARNERLRKMIAPQAQEAARLRRQSGQPERVFTEFGYQITSGSWSRHRRVVAKAKQLEGKENPGFAVINLNVDEWPAQPLFEKLYGERGEMENRVKE